MEYRANIRLSDEANLVIVYDDDSAKLTATEAGSGKTGSVTLTTGAKKKKSTEEEKGE